MITAYQYSDGRVSASDWHPTETTTPVLWHDLETPTPSETESLEQIHSVSLPNVEQMSEIEASSRLYSDHGVLYMTTPILAKGETPQLQVGLMTFVLAKETLITLRYLHPGFITLFNQRLQRNPRKYESPTGMTIGLLEAIIDRAADIVEFTASRVDAISAKVFRPSAEEERSRDLQDLLESIGQSKENISHIRSCLTGLTRLVAFLSTTGTNLSKEERARLKTATRDLRSIAEQADFLTQQVSFLLDATLGVISVQQNNIVKGFSVAATAFFPPTLIASIYGMNFERMPELNWIYGYPAAIVLMVLSAALPLWYFRRRGWL